MSELSRLVTEDIRLAIVQILETDPDYSHNEHIIKAALGQVGHNISSDRVAIELAWLEDAGLISLIPGPVKVARLTARGEDVAMGRSRVPGVARPRPE